MAQLIAPQFIQNPNTNQFANLFKIADDANFRRGAQAASNIKFAQGLALEQEREGRLSRKQEQDIAAQFRREKLEREKFGALEGFRGKQLENEATRITNQQTVNNSRIAELNSRIENNKLERQVLESKISENTATAEERARLRKLKEDEQILRNDKIRAETEFIRGGKREGDDSSFGELQDDITQLSSEFEDAQVRNINYFDLFNRSANKQQFIDAVFGTEGVRFLERSSAGDIGKIYDRINKFKKGGGKSPLQNTLTALQEISKAVKGNIGTPPLIPNSAKTNPNGQ